jgi:hypothetical protein
VPTASLTILLLLILTVWICRRLFGVRPQIIDERDIAIRYKSGMVGFFCFTTFFMLTCIIFIFKFTASQSVPLSHIIRLMFFGWIVLYLTWAIATLAQYRRGV